MVTVLVTVTVTILQMIWMVIGVADGATFNPGMSDSPYDGVDDNATVSMILTKMVMVMSSMDGTVMVMVLSTMLVIWMAMVWMILWPEMIVMTPIQQYLHWLKKSATDWTMIAIHLLMIKTQTWIQTTTTHTMRTSMVTGMVLTHPLCKHVVQRLHS